METNIQILRDAVRGRSPSFEDYRNYELINKNGGFEGYQPDWRRYDLSRLSYNELLEIYNILTKK